MSREEEIRQAAVNYENENGIDGMLYSDEDSFVNGAKWADEHHESKYNISDPDYVVSMLEGIIEDVEFLTTGNLAHNKAAIKFHAREALRVVKTIEK
jgi:hypothetical protein